MRRGGVRTRLIAMAAVPLVAFIAMAAFGWATFNKVRIQGEKYNEVILSKDLVADVLPPPEYIVESYLTVQQLADPSNSGNQDELVSKLRNLETQYRLGHQTWQRQLKDPDIRQALLIDSYKPAIEFFSVVNDQFLSQVEAKKYVQARETANGQLRDLYVRHRAAIDRVVELGSAEQIRVESETAKSIRRQEILLGIMFGALLLITLGLGVAIIRSILRPISRLERIVQEELPQVIEQARTTGFDEGAPPQIASVELGSNDELGRAAAAFNSVVQSAVDLAGEQARQRRNTAETFIHLGRRNQNLVARQLRHIDELERSEGDPALLKHLFRLDHLATRMRRNAESLLVLAGVEPARKWKQPVSVLDVVRASLGEVEGYERVRLDVVQPALLPGYAVADVTHMLAELVENALRYSPPDMPVTITSGYLDSHYQIAIIDRGIGIGPRDLAVANDRLKAGAGFDDVPSASLGLYVVARLARRYAVSVELESSGGDGLTAYVSLPVSLLEQSGPVAGGSPARTARYTGPPSPIAVTPEYPALNGSAGLAGRSVPGLDFSLPGSNLPTAPPPTAALPASTVPDAFPAPPAIAPPTTGPLPAAAAAPVIDSAAALTSPTWNTDDTRPSSGGSRNPDPRDAGLVDSGLVDSGHGRRLDAPRHLDRPRPPVGAPPTTNAADGAAYTTGGLRKRSSKLGTTTTGAPAPRASHRMEPRAPSDVRSRYDNFVAGKRRALDEPDPDSAPPSAGPGRSVPTHTTSED
jgi:signal transduction histidine kinase